MNNSLGYYGFKLQYIWRRFMKMFRKARSINIVIIIVLSSILAFFIYNINSRIYSDQYKVSSIRFTKKSVNQYNDAQLYTHIAELYSWKYYSDISAFWDHKDYNEILTVQYPFIESINIKGFSNNTLLLDVVFTKPLLRFLYKDEFYGAYHNLLLPLNTTDELNNGTPLMLLPIYLKESSISISWLLYEVDISKMLYDLLLLKTVPISWSVTYIPGWDRYILRNNDVRIYLNAKKDINTQLWILSTLMSQYKWFNQLKQIDIGSLDNPIVK